MVLRKCIVTGEINPKIKMLRFVLKNDQTIHLDINNKIQGRGAYCTMDEEIIETLFKKKLLNRSFKTNVSTSIYENLRKEVEKYVK